MSINGYKPKHKGKALWKTVPLAMQPQERDKPFKIVRREREQKRSGLLRRMPKGGASASGSTPRRRIRPVSKNRQQTSRLYREAAKAFVAQAIKRGNGCPVVNTIPELKNGFSYGWPISDNLNEVHHMRGRNGILLLDQTFWLAVSKAGHRWIHSHPKEAREHGWLCAQGDWNKQTL